MKRAIYGIVLIGVMTGSFLSQGDSQTVSDTLLRPVQLTSEQDHQRLMNLLHITALRPGPSGDPNARNAANADESKANPYPDLPDPLILNDGRKVTTPEMWWKLRRPEIKEDFDREIYGKVPEKFPMVTWEIVGTTPDTNAGVPALTKKLLGHVDNSSYPQIKIDIELALTVPANAQGPVPVLSLIHI